MVGNAKENLILMLVTMVRMTLFRTTVIEREEAHLRIRQRHLGIYGKQAEREDQWPKITQRKHQGWGRGHCH